MKAVNEGAEIRPLTDGIRQPHGVAEQGAGARRLDFNIRVDDDGRQAGRHGKADDVRGAGPAHQDEPPADRGRDVVGMGGPGADSLALERARDESLDGRARIEERIDSLDRRRRARGAAAQPAR